MTTYDARPSAFTQLSTTSDWESFLSSCGISDGIDGLGFTPSLDTGGRNAVISAGQCVIKGQLWRADAPVSTSIPAASAQNRLDRLVLQLSRGATSSPTVVQPVVVTGTPSGSPTLPPLTQGNTGIYQIPVSYWTSASSGSLTGLVDQRQFAGRTVVTFYSSNRPTPLNPCLGIEMDTGIVYAFFNNIWFAVGGSNNQQTVQGGNTNNTTSYNALFTPAFIPGGDVTSANGGQVAYHVKCGGHGTQASGTAINFGFQLSAFGQIFANSQDSGGVAAGAAFHWDFDGELIVNANGGASFHGKVSISQALANAQGHVTAMDAQLAVGTISPAVLASNTNITLQGCPTSTTGSPTLVCTGATVRRIAN